MPDDFGLRIGIEGERDFRAALREINQSFKVLGSEMQLVTSKFDRNDKSIQSVTARNTVLNKEIDSQKNKIETLKSALDNAATSFGETDHRTQNWQIQLNKAQAELNNMERELAHKSYSIARLSGLPVSYFYFICAVACPICTTISFFCTGHFTIAGIVTFNSSAVLRT